MKANFLRLWVGRRGTPACSRWLVNGTERNATQRVHAVSLTCLYLVPLTLPLRFVTRQSGCLAACSPPFTRARDALRASGEQAGRDLRYSISDPSRWTRALSSTLHARLRHVHVSRSVRAHGDDSNRMEAISCSIIRTVQYRRQ